MKIDFEKYDESDFNDLAKCMEKLHDYLIAVDPLRRLRRLPGFGKRYTDNLLRKVNRDDGLILLAYDKDKVAGCIVGAIEKQPRDNLLECVPTIAGRILELFVEDSYRSHGVGRELMERMEDYFRQNGCDVFRVEVFEPNRAAHDLYAGMDYQDRAIDMIKLIG